MSYKTNAKSLRLGITHQWYYKAHGPIANFHIDHKIKQYVQNLVEHVVPQAPKNAKTKGSKEKKFPVQPGLQGKTIALRATSEIFIISFFYLNYDGATPKQINEFHSNISRLKWMLHEETKCTINLKLLNYFMFFWRFEAFLGLTGSKRLNKKISDCINRHSLLKAERSYYNLVKKHVFKIKKSIPKTFKRERYYRRSIHPLICSFLFFDFDADIATKAIAFELQILRIEHKKFVYYIRRFFKVSFKLWHKFGIIEGLQLKINGRLTNYRRQSRRTQTKIFTLGLIKRSHTACESGHSLSVAYNRYGAISVQLTYQARPVIAEKWENRSPYTPYNIFSMKEVLENCIQLWDINFKENLHNSTSIINNFCINKQKIESKTINYLNNVFIKYKEKKINCVDLSWNQPKPTKFKLMYSDKLSYTNMPKKDWKARNIFKKYIFKSKKI
jgi:hypothetical protein